MTFPFPFFGAGEASYFEWAEVCVLFVEAPRQSVRAEIDARVPPPLAEDDDSIRWQGPALLVGSGQFAHLTIIDTYPADPGDEDELDDRFRSRWPTAGRTMSPAAPSCSSGTSGASAGSTRC